MSKVKYRYNPETLNYDEVEITLKDRVLKLLSFVGAGLVFAVAIVVVYNVLFDSPKERRQQREIEMLTSQYNKLKDRMNHLDLVLTDIQKRDDNIYRTIFEAEPIPDNIRKAGIGGSNRYKNLDGFEYSDLVVETNKRLDKIAKQVYIQSKSFDEVIEMAKKKEKMLASIPAVMPVANKDLKRTASGFGYRIDPIYKTQKMHTGMDFTADTGTDVYATGNGVVESVEVKKWGYGKHVVIDHGYGYKTMYAHLIKFNVKKGQKVKRGDLIGFVGSTGKSTAPHLHYEVIKDGNKVNPANYYYNDLTPAQFEQMLKLSSNANQSFD